MTDRIKKLEQNRGKTYWVEEFPCSNLTAMFETNGKFTTRFLSISIMLSNLLAAPEGWFVPTSYALTYKLKFWCRARG